MKTIKDNQKGKQKMIVKAFNQEFNININVAVSQINLKIVRLIESKRVDLLRELNDFIAADRAEYDKVKSAARAEYDEKINKKLDELLARIEK